MSRNIQYNIGNNNQCIRLPKSTLSQFAEKNQIKFQFNKLSIDVLKTIQIVHKYLKLPKVAWLCSQRPYSAHYSIYSITQCRNAECNCAQCLSIIIHRINKNRVVISNHWLPRFKKSPEVTSLLRISTTATT